MRRHSLVLIFICVIAGFSSLPQRAQAEAAPRHIQIIAKRFAFDPAEVTLKKGEPVILVLKSVDVPHGLRFRELHVDLKVNKGGTTEARLTPEKTGTFIGHCSVFCGAGHGSMTLKLRVVE
jgi:cytochrome c oxidase subunit 2